MNICMVGTGYVGLVTGTCLADFGMDVTCVDKDPVKLEMLQKGVSPIYEPGLDKLVDELAKGRPMKKILRRPQGQVGAIDPAVALGDGHQAR